MTTLKTVADLEKRLRSSKKNANDLLRLQSVLKASLGDADTFTLALRTYQAIRLVLREWATNGDLIASTTLTKSAVFESESATALERFQQWSGNQYKRLLLLFLSVLQAESVSTPGKALALNGILELMQMSIVQQQNIGTELTSPARVFSRLILIVLQQSNTQILDLLISRIGSHTDLRYYTLRVVLYLLDEGLLDAKANGSVLYLLLHYPEHTDSAVFLSVLESEGSSHRTMQSVAEGTKVYTDCWIRFLGSDRPFSFDMYTRILMSADTLILPRLTSPLVLSDFIADSYDQGGIVSVLALRALFSLIQTHNFDYPDFYPKLYRLLTPALFDIQHTDFIGLLYLFLRSPHLSSYLVASFVKRLARLALVSPPETTVQLITLVFNLLRRNPSCRCLLDTQSETEVEEDPFVEDCAELQESRAMESSLWEIAALQAHTCPAVALLARRVLQTTDFPKADWEMPENAPVVSRYATKRYKNASLAPRRPTVVFE